MARSKDSFNSKDREKAKLKKRKDKEQKKEQRKANSGKGKGLENMFAYVDAFGNLLSSPPDPGQKQDVNPEDIIISIARKVDSEPDDQRHTGTVTFFNESKGYGFIKNDLTNQSIFVHVNNLESPVKEQDKVSFSIENGYKGLTAVDVRIVPDTDRKSTPE